MNRHLTTQRRVRAARHHRALLWMAIASLVLCGCETAPSGAGRDDSFETSPSLDSSDWQTLPPLAPLVEDLGNTARGAARVMNRLPDYRGSRAWAGLSLHRTLFAEAFEFAFEQGHFSPLLGLREPRSGPAGIEARDYAVFILGSLVEKSPSLAWIELSDTDLPRYPGTDRAATLLSINILHFSADRGIAGAEISIRLPDGREIGRTTLARFDGSDWSLEYQPLRWTR